MLKLSIVTPSFNQGQFLEETIRSVLDQNYPNLEYAIIDGGSTDDSVEIIRRYENRLTYWVSKPDEGQYYAIQQGFDKTHGEIMAWINSDDKYTPWAFQIATDIFDRFPQIEWITSLFPMVWSETGQAVKVETRQGYSRQGFFRGEYTGGPGSSGAIQQESTFWRRSLWEKSGAQFDLSLRHAGDFELWAKFFKHAEPYGVLTTLGGFRVHPTQKTANLLEEYLREVFSTLHKYNGRLQSRIEKNLRSHLLGHLPQRVLNLGIGVSHTYNNCYYQPTKGWKVRIVKK